MPIVIDSNILIISVSGDPRRARDRERIRRWMEAGDELHAPSLLPYEVANGLTRLIAAGLFPAERMEEAWHTVMSIPIIYHEVRSDGPEIVALSLRLQRRSAYDAAYLALAQRLGAELWTFDGPLARNAAGLGFPVHLVE